MPQGQPAGLDVELSSLSSIGDSDTHRTRNLSQSSDRSHLDLEASLLAVPSPGSHLKENVNSGEKRTADHSWHCGFDIKAVRSSFHQLCCLVYAASCRVVDIGEDDEEFSSYHKLHNLSNSSSINATPSTVNNAITLAPKKLLITRWPQHILHNTWTPPFVFLLILFQTVALVVGTIRPKSYQSINPFAHPVSWIYPCYVAIFSFYIIELILRGAAFSLHHGSAFPTKLHLTLRNFFVALDFLAVISFWVHLTIILSKTWENRFLQVLAMLSALRALRLLRITAGTNAEITVIFEALKNSHSKLVRVGAFTCVFWLLFATIGVQVFKSSLRRSCVLPETDPFSTRTNFEESQFCGGHLVDEGGLTTAKPWITSNGSPGASGHKGYLCPRGMLCQESSNPYNDTVSFDNVFQSLELVFVIFSANTFSTLMYNIIDSDGLIAAVFFAAVIVVLYFWLLILLIGVIMGSIQQIREQARTPKVLLDHGPLAPSPDPTYKQFQRSESLLRKIYRRSKWFWIAMITFNLVAQAQRTSQMSRWTRLYIDYSESVVTWSLLAEIIIRLMLDGTAFPRSKQNLVDLFLAIITCAMQLKAFQQSGRTYAWFTAFSIARSYRIFWAISPIRSIMVRALLHFISNCSFSI
jgi:hypothetical protein